MRFSIYTNLFHRFFGQGGCIFSLQKKTINKNLKEGSGEEKKRNYCVFYLPDARRKKTIDQVYKRRPKEYLGRERKREREREKEREREREKQIIEF